MSQSWQSAAEAVLGQSIVGKQSLSGGDFAASYSAVLADGTRIFIKTHKNPPPHFFSTEAAGLAALHKTGTVRIPEVLAFSDDPPFLALEWIEIGADNQRSDETLGAALAEMHRIEQAAFGRDDQRTTGSLGVPNQVLPNWVDFYATQRLQPLAEIARKRKALSPQDCDNLSIIAKDLKSSGLSDDPPSLLHGDLWAGNRIVDTSGNSWLIDPAMHRGHREFDVSMMLLFGGYSERCFSAYIDTYPLQPDFESRVPMHQLAPLVVHAIKFGGSYRSAVGRAIKATQKLLA